MGCVKSKEDQRAQSQTTIIVIQQSGGAAHTVDSVVRQTGMERDFVALLHRHFYNVCPDGQMGPSEFIAMYLAIHEQSTGNEHLVKFLARLFLVFDQDESGDIDFLEFAKTMNSIADGSTAERLGVIFRLCDTDKNGSIDRMEFLGTLQNLSAFIPGEATLTGLALMAFANRAFEKMDLMGTGEVTPAAFIAALALNDDDDSISNVIRLVFSALVRVVTGDPPLPKQLRILDITLNM